MGYAAAKKRKRQQDLEDAKRAAEEAATQVSRGENILFSVVDWWASKFHQYLRRISIMERLIDPDPRGFKNSLWKKSCLTVLVGGRYLCNSMHLTELNYKSFLCFWFYANFYTILFSLSFSTSLHGRLIFGRKFWRPDIQLIQKPDKWHLTGYPAWSDSEYPAIIFCFYCTGRAIFVLGKK